MYDVYSLTYMYQVYMWYDYVSNGNGICIEFEVGVITIYILWNIVINQKLILHE